MNLHQQIEIVNVVLMVFVDLYSSEAPPTALDITAIVIGIEILTLFFAFTVYASVANYRISREFRQSSTNGPDTRKMVDNPWM